MCEFCGCGLIQSGERAGKTPVVATTLGTIPVAVIDPPVENEPQVDDKTDDNMRVPGALHETG
jgi:hypothetical protein